MNRPKVAIADSFLDAYARIPRAEQKKVREFTEKFRFDPTQPSIHYEPIHGMRDGKVRTVRIGLDYRAIVVQPPSGDVHLLVWVDHHDEAMAWAKRKVFDVNPVLGSLQVYGIKEGEAALPPPGERASMATTSAPDRTIPSGRLLEGVAYDDLIVLGVPEPLLPAVIALRTEADLVELTPYLPEEAGDALTLLAAGESPNVVLTELERARSAKPISKVDVDGFAAALEHPDSKRHFKVIESEDELDEILRAPLAKWRIFLHPLQQKLVEWDAAGPVRVLGGAGTGKTVVAMHRARHLAKQLKGRPDARVLVTTFTRNLATDIDRALELLCGDEKRQIEVMNLHQWANRLLRSKGVDFSIAEPDLLRKLWDEACTEADVELAPAFYRDEWEYVVQAQDIQTLDEYIDARRVGRGTRLSRKQKIAVWDVFAQYRALLNARGKFEQADVIREARLYLEKHPGLLPYAAVVADEVQDMRPAELRLIRAIVPKGRNDIMVVGDGHQRIYRHQASLGACGIEIVGRSKRLKVNYRTTERIRAFGVGLLEGLAVDDLDSGQDHLKGYRSLRDGEAPEICTYRTLNAEIAGIVERIRGLREQYPAEEICLTARTNDLLDRCYRRGLEAAGIDVAMITSEGEATLGPGIRLATMHRLKGLEFPCVLIAGFDEGVLPLSLPAGLFADGAAEEDHERAERCLAYVAATRARDKLIITSSGRASAWIADTERGR